MLERQQLQLVAALHRLCKIIQNGHIWTGPPLREISHGVFPTHEILEHLGLLELESHQTSEGFQTALNTLNHRFIVDQRAGAEKLCPSGIGRDTIRGSAGNSWHRNSNPVTHLPSRLIPDREAFSSSTRTILWNETSCHSEATNQPKFGCIAQMSGPVEGVNIVIPYDSPKVLSTTDPTGCSTQTSCGTPPGFCSFSTSESPDHLMSASEAMIRSWRPDAANDMNAWIAVSGEGMHEAASVMNGHLHNVH